MYTQRNTNLKDLVPGEKETTNLAREMNMHHGQIVERVVRRSPKSISGIARELQVSRRTLYNWFETSKLDIDNICKIALVTGHDFTTDLPEKLEIRTKMLNFSRMADLGIAGEMAEDPIRYWMERYITLLEQFNERLILPK